MSVIVNGMEMPKNCGSCWISRMRDSSLGGILDCKILGTVGTAMDDPHDILNNRHPDCPLVELPEKHGRLIDVDALIDDCKKYLNSLNPSRDGKECTRIHWLIGVLSNAPTIEPERKKGEWKHISDGYVDIYECDQCGKREDYERNYCPDCGAYMKKENKIIKKY